jgi:hypothetical protein
MALLTLFWGTRRLARVVCACVLMLCVLPGLAQESPMSSSERELKAAFLYNFMLFTEWPAETGKTLTLCVLEPDPLGHALAALQGKAVGTRQLSVQTRSADALKACDAVFMAASAAGTLTRVLEGLRGKPVLTIADRPDATRQGVVLNMAITANRISFEANLLAAREAHLQISSKLLRLATGIIQ